MNNLKNDAKLAVELEEKGHQFYVQAAAKTGNPLAKATLESLAQREVVHLEKVKSFYQDLTGAKKLPAGWLSSAFIAPAKGALLKPILLKLKASLEQKPGTGDNVDQSYATAEELERDSYQLYERLARESTDALVKKFFAALAAEENEHFAILDETLQYLNTPGDWFRKEERWIVEG